MAKPMIDLEGAKAYVQANYQGDPLIRHMYEVLLEKLPTKDAVPVVRCRDCKHGMKSHLQPRHTKNYLCRHSWEGEYHEPDHFCSYGERRTDG